MDEIILKNIRCFHEKQNVPIAPITFLVGENSSGKTSFLASTRIACRLLNIDEIFDFNEEPFSLGTFDQIAHFRHGRGGGTSEQFSIGFSLKLDKDFRKKHSTIKDKKIEIVGVFEKGDPQPALSRWELNCSPFSVIYELKKNGKKDPTLKIKGPSGKAVYPIGSPGFIIRPHLYFLKELKYLEKGFLGRKRGEKKKKSSISEKDLDLFGDVVDYLFGRVITNVFSFAPIRTTPRRTYDTLTEAPNSTGDHIPNILAKTYSNGDDTGSLRKSLKEFGEMSGLFSDLEVKRFGRKDSSPFQIKVKIAGPAFNIVDVGYGVSQVLPLIVDSLNPSSSKVFLMQQPEVHLHPRAQAGLGTFLLGLATNSKKRFIVETHSDYIIDRVRHEIRGLCPLTPIFY